MIAAVCSSIATSSSLNSIVLFTLDIDLHTLGVMPDYGFIIRYETSRKLKESKY